MRPLSTFPPPTPAQVEQFIQTVPNVRPALMYVARGVIRNRSCQEDIVQNALYQAFRKLATFRGDSKLSTWIVAICRNEAIMWVRKERHLTMQQPPEMVYMDHLPESRGRALDREISFGEAVPDER